MREEVTPTLYFFQQGLKNHVFIKEFVSVLCDKRRGKNFQILLNVANALGKILNAVRNAAVVLIVQNFKYLVSHKKPCAHDIGDVFFLHPLQPDLFNVFINTNRYIV